MRKKLMSCVLAVVFVMSIAVNLIAAETGYNFGNNATQDGANSGTSNITAASNTGNVPSEAQKYISNITQVYGYAS